MFLIWYVRDRCVCWRRWYKREQNSVHNKNDEHYYHTSILCMISTWTVASHVYCIWEWEQSIQQFVFRPTKKYIFSTSYSYCATTTTTIIIIIRLSIEGARQLVKEGRIERNNWEIWKWQCQSMWYKFL